LEPASDRKSHAETNCRHHQRNSQRKVNGTSLFTRESKEKKRFTGPFVLVDVGEYPWSKS